ncbi:MAG: Hpt domain-containing protein [Pirellulales bacterium]|nr:Hpt domain-containing protein [Pirellulales bacterium]
MSAVCNLGIALNRLGGNRKLLRELISFFREDAPKLLKQIEDGLACGNARQVQIAAHSLRGLAANFEALSCASTMAQLEEHGRAGNLEAASRLWPDAVTSVENLSRALAISFDQPRA